MKTLELKLSVRLEDREAQRLTQLANAHGLSQAQLVRTLIRWLPCETIEATIDQSKGYTK
jgi:predicted DNA-binding protein